jgi:O-acetyl-ADP-ribose deacetylase (regulator of RNase III)
MQEGDTLPGNIFVSTAGRLPFKHIIHAVAEKWVGGKKDEKNLLFVAVQTALTEVVERGLRTVALPASFAERCRFPADIAVRIIVDSIIGVMRDRPALKEVLIVARDQSEVDTFVKEMDAIVPISMPNAEELARSKRRHVNEAKSSEIKGQGQQQRSTTNAAPAEGNF